MDYAGGTRKGVAAPGVGKQKASIGVTYTKGGRAEMSVVKEFLKSLLRVELSPRRTLDMWTSEGMKYAPILPKGVVIYGELIGYVPGTSKPIQKGYTYDVPVGDTHLYVYRVSVVTEDAHQYDLGDTAMREFCSERGLNVVPKLWEGYKIDFVPGDWIDQDFYCQKGYTNAVPLAKASPCDEGIVIRIEGVMPKTYKVKSPLFFAHESKILDEGDEVLS